MTFRIFRFLPAVPTLLAVSCGGPRPSVPPPPDPPPGVAVYVALNGSDTNAGTAAQPFATLERAGREVRAVKQSGAASNGVTVFLRGGLYAVTNTVQLGPGESGEPGAPVTWRAAPGETVVLAGGRSITGFAPLSNGIFKADVAAQGFTGIRFRQLVFDGRRQHLARYPDFDPENPYGGGWAYADGKSVPMYADVPGEDKRTLRYKEADARSWSRPDEGEVFVFPRYNWWNNIVRIATVDPAARTIKLAGDCSYPIRPTDRYYVRNLFEELDAPGEWWLDRATWTLYFKPPAPLEGRAVVAPMVRTILELKTGAHDIEIRGLTFECSEGTAVTLKNTTNCLVAACTIRNVGDYNGSGVSIDGGRNNGVRGCDIHDTGSHGVSLHGGDRITLAPAGNYADNNYIHHVGVFYKQGVGVSVGGCGQRVSHNLIHDGPRMGILFGGNNHVFEFNRLRHLNLETADTGAIYTGGRDWLGSRGCAIRFNFFHDILGYGQEDGKWVSPHYAWGVYLDDNTGGVDVYGNIVARCIRGLIHLHNGRDNHVENNIFINGSLQQLEANGWTPSHRYWATHLPTMIKGYESVAGQPAWRAMRNMDLHPTNAVRPDGTIMSGNRFARNIVCWSGEKSLYAKFRNLSFEYNACDSNLLWHGGAPIRTGETAVGRDRSGNRSLREAEPMDEWQAWQAKGADRHSIVADPMFIDAAKDDYRLRPGSPAFRLGFQPIPIEKIGPYADERRATWPIVEAEGAREKPLTGGNEREVRR